MSMSPSGLLIQLLPYTLLPHAGNPTVLCFHFNFSIFHFNFTSIFLPKIFLIHTQSFNFNIHEIWNFIPSPHTSLNSRLAYPPKLLKLSSWIPASITLGQTKQRKNVIQSCSSSVMTSQSTYLCMPGQRNYRLAPMSNLIEDAAVSSQNVSGNSIHLFPSLLLSLCPGDQHHAPVLLTWSSTALTGSVLLLF